MLQNAWPVHVRMLRRYGSQARPVGSYVDALIEASPFLEEAAIAGAEPGMRDAVEPNDASHRLLLHGIEVLAFERFVRPIGPVTPERYVPDRSKPSDSAWMV